MPIPLIAKREIPLTFPLDDRSDLLSGHEIRYTDQDGRRHGAITLGLLGEFPTHIATSDGPILLPTVMSDIVAAPLPEPRWVNATYAGDLVVTDLCFLQVHSGDVRSQRVIETVNHGSSWEVPLSETERDAIDAQPLQGSPVAPTNRDRPPTGP